MFKKHDQQITKLLSAGDKSADWSKILAHHRLMLARIQHERLIHLLVTIFVGLSAVICFLADISYRNMFLGFITLTLLALFSAYIFHYRFLENTTQKWYRLEDEISTHFMP